RSFLARLGAGAIAAAASGCARLPAGSKRWDAVLDQKRFTSDLQVRQRHLRDCARHRVQAGAKLTTPPPNVDVEAIPDLAQLRKTTVRLHPRFGDEPALDQTKMGGSFLWPKDEPWPRCPDHEVPYVTVLQLRAEQFPEIAFYPGTNLFQLLWCP